MTYNQKRHLELLKRSQDLKKQKKHLFLENEEEYFELSEYQIYVNEYIFWQDRYQFGLLMEDFLNKKIDAEEFCGGIYGFHNKLIKTCEEFNLELTSGSEKTKVFQSDSRSKNLIGFLNSLFCECDNFGFCKCDDFDDDCYDCENDEFYTFIKNVYLNFQEVLNEE